jgi:mycothiol synthase
LTEQQVVLRAATDADADRLADFINTCTLAYQGVARSSPAEARAQLYEHGTDPAVDTRLALVQDDIVGFGRVWAASDEELRLYARTHPAATGTGIGSALLAFCEGRARELAPEQPRELTTTSWAADDRAPELLTGFGFAPVRYFLKMKIASDVISDRPRWPAGVDIEPFSEGRVEENALYGAWREAFSGHWGRMDQGAAKFWEERRNPDRDVFPFDPSLWFVATSGGEVAGFSLCEQNGALGRVAEIGVVDAYRGRGLGLALLTHSFHELRLRGADEIVLDVDSENVTSAIRLYTKAGMTPHPSFTIWGKEVQGAQR